MEKRSVILFPKSERLLEDMGENLKLARKRRKLSTEQVAQRANIARSTLWLVERGSPSVAIGIYVQVLFVLGLERDIAKLGADDELGHKLQDAKLLQSAASKPLRKRK
ncbi:MAG: XRE family transcriptional regulator [Flavobacterium sp.]|uniref:helix-turn-helix domain-containing protein n=1 Tax=Pedobacter miscanthi TaxID=2259170 RepID=UPI00122444BD|nr:helix-turn-helix transcriptional regulator [Pedobacter miscanthi]RZJ67859.1 MAG: XRE family transcriptional regulator [Flavobacterium sp.]